MEPAVDRIVQDALKIWGVPGAAVVIVQQNKVRLVKGYGKREIGRPESVTAETIFPIGSCSKAFTTVVLAMLADEGKLSWDDPVSKHLPGFHLYDRRADALVTIRDLVSHRTGVGSHDLLWYRASWSQEETVHRLAFVPPSGEFRSSYYYSTPQFMAAGQAAAKYCPQGWDGFVRDRILNPLQMTHTYLNSDAALRDPNHASPHRVNREGMLQKIDWFPFPLPNPAGSVYSSANDMGKWLRFQLGDGTWNGRRLVSATNLDETHKPNIIIPMIEAAVATYPYTVQLTYAMGWVVQDYRGVKLISHGGIVEGFKVNLALVPAEQIGIGVLVNEHATLMSMATINSILDLMLGAPAKDWNAHFGQLMQAQDKSIKEANARREHDRDLNDKPSLSFADYAGIYEHPAYGECRVDCRDGRLHWHWSSFNHVLEPYRHDTFEIKDINLNDPLVEFLLEAKQVRSMRFRDIMFLKKK
ncbi:MAG TPA: serine hydrolase [Gemmataceae bacterium]|nr:serine hydrolase [Gemmataceae bacterium]